MSRWTPFFAGAALLFSFATASDVQAQRALGLSAGLSFPMGEIGEEFDTGFQVSGLFETKLSALPFPLRAEVGYQQFTHDDDKLTHLSGILNALFPVGDRAFLIGGLGLYVTKEESDHGDHSHGDAENLLGFNFGAGFKLPVAGLNVTLESRIHSVIDEDHGGQRFIPLAVTIRF
jgi:hypothetical protein